MNTQSGLPRRLGRYWMLRRLATGGLAEVYLGLQQGPSGFRKPVAVKKLHEHVAEKQGLVQTLAEEARLTSQLNHHHIAQVHEFHKEAGEGFLIYEFVPGVTLGDLLRREDGGEKPSGGPAIQVPIGLGEASAIALGMARALEHAESRLDRQGQPLGLVHRDISPPNVMITFDGVVKVIDFGIAKARDQTERTETGVVKGKFRYMSPEQFAGEDSVDIRTDLYALGAVLFELLAGRPLYRADSDLGLMAKVQQGDHPDLRAALPDQPESLYLVLERLLALDPEARYSSAGEVVGALRGLQQAAGVSASSEDLLRPLLERRFPGEGEALNRELASLEAPESLPETVVARHETRTMVSLEEQVTVMDATRELLPPGSRPGWDDSLTDLREQSQASLTEQRGPANVGSTMGLVILGLVMTGASFFLVRGLKKTPPPVVKKVLVRHTLTVDCPTGATVTIVGPGQSGDRQTCPALERVERGAYTLTIRKEGYEEMQRQIEVNGNVRFPRNGELGMRRVVGRLAITTEPSGATVTIDGKPYTEEVALDPGSYEVVVKAKGFVSDTQKVEVLPEKTRRIDVKLERPAMGKLTVHPPRSGWGHVHLGRRRLCTLPPTCTGVRLPAGRHRLEYRSVGPPLARTVTIRAGKTTVLDLGQ